MTILIDAHAHLHHTPVDRALDAAAAGFAKAARAVGVRPALTLLLLSEGRGEAGFDDASRRRSAGRWRLGPATEPGVLRAESADATPILLVAGRQLRTREGLEVHALCSTATLGEGDALQDTIAAARAAGALVVLPWGAGKWWGRRGRLVREVLDREEDVLVSDNGGRPWPWPTPGLLARERARGRPVLAGSDPLPLPGEAARLGTYGTVADVGLDDAAPVTDLRRALRAGGLRTRTYGPRSGALAFVARQLRMRAGGGSPPLSARASAGPPGA